MVTVSVRTGPQVVGYLSQVSLYYFMRNYRQHSQLAVPSRVDTMTEKEQVWLASASKVIEADLSPSTTL